MGSALYFEKTVLLSPVEQRYIASCDCVAGYKHCKETEMWKKQMAGTAQLGEPITVNSSEMLVPFPTLAYLICAENLGQNRSVQEYFEGMDEQSHNLRLYRLAQNALRNPDIPQYLLNGILSHARDCSVKLAKADGTAIWSCTGVVADSLDDMFGVEPHGDYALTHGRSEKGLIIIREAYESDLERLQKLPDLWKE